MRSRAPGAVAREEVSESEKSAIRISSKGMWLSFGANILLPADRPRPRLASAIVIPTASLRRSEAMATHSLDAEGILENARALVGPLTLRSAEIEELRRLPDDIYEGQV